MRPHANFIVFVLASSLTTLTAWAFQSSPAPKITFRGTDYLLRSTHGNQSNYTPAGQEDESKFTDSLTLNLYPAAHDQQALATITGRVRTIAENAKATILPASSGADEHYFAAVMPTPHGADFDATRFVLVNNEVVGVFYTRRAYGASAVDTAQDWATKNAASVEQGLMRIDASQVISSAGNATAPSPVANNAGLPPGTTKAGTLTSPRLMNDTMQGVAGKVAVLGCDKIEDVARYVVTPFSGAPRYRQWQEKWIVKGCGKQYPVDISFKEDGSGGADWAIKN
jgi:hypothetical protein